MSQNLEHFNNGVPQKKNTLSNSFWNKILIVDPPSIEAQICTPFPTTVNNNFQNVYPSQFNIKLLIHQNHDHRSNHKLSNNKHQHNSHNPTDNTNH